MTTPDLIRLCLLWFAGTCIMTIAAFILYLLFACIAGIWIKRRTPVKRMRVEEMDGVEVEEVV
jgi:hypothetical protein